MVRNLFKSVFGLKGALFMMVAFLCLPLSAQAQNYTEAELDTLVSTIALYPDPLLVQVLTASTYGDQIPAANMFAQSHKNLKGQALADAIEKAEMGYDPSVQALIPFPDVLNMMDKYAAWCNQLGEAMDSQKEDVMAAVQRMRRKAYDYGHLQTNENVKVVVDTVVAIQPAKVEYVYVPVYNPRVVYYTPYSGVVYVNYGSGIYLGSYFGEWGWGTCWFDWNYRVMYVRNYSWYRHRRIPHHPHHYVPAHRGFGPPPGHRTAPAPAPRMAPALRAKASAPAARRVAPAAAPSRISTAPAPRASAPAPRSTAAPAPRASAPAPKSTNASTSLKRSGNDEIYQSTAPAPAPAMRTAPAPSTRTTTSAPLQRASSTSEQRSAPAPRSYGSSRSNDRTDYGSRHSGGGSSHIKSRR